MMDLSDEQAKAVYTDSKRALCIASAGSGKTRTLIARVQHLVENCQVSPHEIVAITFTRKASGEMRERLKAVIGPDADLVSLGTIHGYALDMIQRFGDLVGLRPNKITVYSEWEEQFLLKDVCSELGYYDGKKYKGTNKTVIDKAFFMFYTEGVRENLTCVEQTILSAFLARCRENNALTYGTILTTFMDLLPRIGQYLNYRHIMVDEVQDNDKLQWQIINNLSVITGASLFAVGDTNQSIYSFRGADPEYLIIHRHEFDIFTLLDNYRSDKNIVDAANRLIKHNQSRFDFEMNAKKPAVCDVMYSKDNDSSKLAYAVQSFFSSNMPVTVLGRNHFLLEKLSRLLEEKKIDHDYIGKKKALTMSEEFRRVHAFLKLVVNPYDNFSFLLIKDIVGVDQEEYSKIRMKAVSEDKSHFQTWIELDNPEDIGTYVQVIYPLKSDMMEEVFNLICDEIEFDFDVHSTILFIDSWIKYNEGKTIEDYLNWLAIYDVQDEISNNPKSVQLMTIHASKGLEFQTVMIAGMNEGILPSKHARSSQEELESETRLCYVAMTRAENKLVLTSRPEQDENGEIKYPVSRYVDWSLAK